MQKKQKRTCERTCGSIFSSFGCMKEATIVTNLQNNQEDIEASEPVDANSSFSSFELFYGNVMYWLSLLHNFIQQSLNSGSVQVQILFAACWRFTMVRISDKLVNHTTKTIHHHHHSWYYWNLKQQMLAKLKSRHWFLKPLGSQSGWKIKLQMSDKKLLRLSQKQKSSRNID